MTENYVVDKSAVIDILAEFDMLGPEFIVQAQPLTISIPSYEWHSRELTKTQAQKGLSEVIDYCMSDTDDWQISIWRDADGSVMTTIVNEEEELE